MGWVANVLIIIGLWKIGYKQRNAFLYSIAGELIWAATSYYKAQYDLAFICIVFCILAFKNWLQWGKGERR